MLKSADPRKKLLPLRRFAVPGLYSLTYLSLLVQRKKLKAEKIGRNYYTSEEWFTEYIEEHAQEKKWSKYEKINHVKTNRKEGNSLEKKDNEPSFYENLKLDKLNSLEKEKSFHLRSAVITAAVFVLLIFSYQFFQILNKDKGQIAGDEEVSEEIIATSTEEKIKTEFNNGSVHFGQ